MIWDSEMQNYIPKEEQTEWKTNTEILIEKMKKDIAERMETAKNIMGSMNNDIEGWLSEYLIKKGWTKNNDD